MRVDIIHCPPEASQSRIDGKSVVVIDVFRATSCICTAMSNGARRVLPYTTVEQCWDKKEELAANSGDHRVILGGERKMLLIDGFDLGNSPLGYSKDVVEGATIIMSTTNGTRSIELAQKYGASEILIASMLNAQAVVRRLMESGRDVELFCSGRADKFSIEDTLCAGYIVSLMMEQSGVEIEELAWWASEVYKRNQDNLIGAMSHNQHYYRLLELGLGEDVDYCLSRDVLDIVPRVSGREVIL